MILQIIRTSIIVYVLHILYQFMTTPINTDTENESVIINNHAKLILELKPQRKIVMMPYFIDEKEEDNFKIKIGPPIQNGEYYVVYLPIFLDKNNVDNFIDQQYLPEWEYKPIIGKIYGISQILYLPYIVEYWRVHMLTNVHSPIEVYHYVDNYGAVLRNYSQKKIFDNCEKSFDYIINDPIVTPDDNSDISNTNTINDNSDITNVDTTDDNSDISNVDTTDDNSDITNVDTTRNDLCASDIIIKKKKSTITSKSNTENIKKQSESNKIINIKNIKPYTIDLTFINYTQQQSNTVDTTITMRKKSRNRKKKSTKKNIKKKK